MTPRPFNIGDTVRLKSGGPVMTVKVIKDTDAVITVWFPDEKQPVEHQFPPDVLEKDERQSQRVAVYASDKITSPA